MLAAAILTGLLAGCDQLQSGGAGQLRVSTTPPGATVYLDGVRHDATPTTVTRVSAGAHLVMVEKEGYRTARRTVNMLQGNIAVEFKLEPLLGLILIHSNPAGADITVDGAFRGKTPLLAPDFPLGDHRILLTHPGYLPKELAVTVQDRIPQRIQADLVSDTGRIVVNAMPVGAQVRVNGADRGATPCEVDVPSGEVDVQVVAPGYETYRESITISPQERREIAVQLKPVPVTLEIVSIPPKARIYVNNQFRGEAPVLVTDLNPGDHRLRAELPGFETQARDVSLRRESRVVEEFRMVKNSGKIVIVTEPADVKVFLNGEERGTTTAAAAGLISDPLEIDLLQPGTYRLQLARTGFSHAGRTVTLAPNAVVTLHEKMTRMFVPDIRVQLGDNGDIVREGMLIRESPNGDIELQLQSGTIIKIRADEIFKKAPLREP